MKEINKLDIFNCSFISSTASKRGGIKLLSFDAFLGVIYLLGNFNNLTITFCTFFNSTAILPGGKSLILMNFRNNLS